VKVYIGDDEREHSAYLTAALSLRKHSPQSTVTPLQAERLAAFGLLRRAQDRRGRIYDLPSNAYCSTDFAISRFLVPHLAQTGWALFVDADVVFLGPVEKLYDIADERFAVMVVKHPALDDEGVKMDGQAQVAYPRKNCSSVVLWNCDHPANRRLSLQDVNERPGRDLHRFYWLADSEIGALPGEWNWLVGEQPMPDAPRIAHFTNGGPFTPGWQGAEHDDLWLRASRG
jgi:hypothetical protein